MAQQGQNISHQAGEIAGQAQHKKDEILNQVSNASQQHPSYASQASDLLQQTGDQVKNMAQGAADAVKHTLGMDANNPSGNNPGNIGRNNNPSNPSTRI